MKCTAVLQQLARSCHTTPADVLEVAQTYRLVHRLALTPDSQIRKSATEMVRLILRLRTTRRPSAKSAA